MRSRVAITLCFAQLGILVSGSSCTSTAKGKQGPPPGRIAVVSAGAGWSHLQFDGTRLVRFPGHQLEFFDLSDPRVPVTSAVPVATVNASCYFVCGPFVVRGATTYISNLGILEAVGATGPLWTTTNGVVGDADLVSVSDGLASQSVGGNLELLDVTSGGASVASETAVLTNELHVAGTTIFVVTSSQSLHPSVVKVDASTLSSPVVTATVQLAASAGRFVSPGNGGFLVSEGSALDGTDLYALLVTTNNTASQNPGPAGTCTVAWYALGTNGSLASPQALSSEDFAGCYTIAATHGFVFVGMWYRGSDQSKPEPHLLVLHFNPSKGLALVDSVPLDDSPEEVAVDSTRGLVAVGLNQEIELFDYGVLTGGPARWP